MRKINTRRDFLKLHIAIDVETGIIQAFTITEGKAHDSPEFKRLLRYLPRIAKCLGDSAYSSRKNCEIVVKKGGKSYLKFKVNANGRAKASPSWRVSYREYKKDSENWLAEYHLRSIIESVFCSIKKHWHSFLKSKLGYETQRTSSQGSRVQPKTSSLPKTRSRNRDTTQNPNHINLSGIPKLHLTTRVAKAINNLKIQKTIP